MSRNERYGWLGLLWQAVFLGLSSSILMALLTLLLAPQAQAAETSPGLGLYDSRGELAGYAPRLGTEVSITVTGMLARVTVRQRFSNPGEKWLEGIYVFPLPEDAAVDRLRMSYDGRLVEGEIQEKQKARRTYERARASGQGASLLDQQRANIFTTSVANIPPNETVQIEIEYQQRLQWRAGEFSLRFPLVVGPRYIPGTPLPGERDVFSARGWARDTDQVQDASQITPPVVLRTEERFNTVSIEVDLNAGLKLAGITSPYHPIDVRESAPGRYSVVLAEGNVPADRDFVLRWRPLLTDQPTAALFSEVWKGKHYGLLMVMPPQPQSLPEPVARELVLVVDTSGSMHGDSIAQAREALLSALQQLKPGDRFNIIQFNSGLDALFDEAMLAAPAHLEQARHYVRALQAEGGTEMLPAMRLALDDPHPSGLLRQVVFLTDGAVGNEQALFEAVARGAGDSRLFTVGIGSAPNALFMQRAAEFGRGTFTYIGSTREVQQKVASLFRQISAPVLTDVRLNWQMEAGAGPVAQAPQAVPDLYAGEPLVVAIEAGAAPAAVRIEGRLGGHPWRQGLGLQGGAAGDAVHALWARRMIEDWMARRVTGEDQDRVRDAVLALALEHRLVSRYTSLVAVDRAPARPSSSGLRSAQVPTHLPAGWSASAVFGQLPGTATPAPLFMLLGLALLALALISARRWA
ncbi:MAG: marine proteobacterial sortase target protein [Sedimenticolaceae bacterium]